MARFWRNGLGMRLGLGFALLLVSLAVSACGSVSATYELTLYDDDSYETVSELSLPTGALASEDVRASIEQSLDDAVEQATVEGARATWRALKPRRPGDASYLLSAKDATFESLRADGVTIEEMEFRGRKALRVDLDTTTERADLRVIIHGGNILESNGTEIGRGSVSWDNPTSDKYVILTPKSRFMASLTSILPIGLGLVVAMYILYRFIRLRRQRQPWGAQVAQIVYCPHCGAAVWAGSRFCAQCGNPIPLRW